MSFICDDCHVKGTGDKALSYHGWFSSYGPCEICGYQDSCVHCQCQMMRPADEIRAEVRAEQEALKKAREEQSKVPA